MFQHARTRGSQLVWGVTVSRCKTPSQRTSSRTCSKSETGTCYLGQMLLRPMLLRPMLFRSIVTSDGWGPEGWRARNFALFSLFSHNFRSFSVFLGGLLVEFWWCFHTTAREPKCVHLSFPTFRTPPKFKKKTPRERRINENGGGRG